MTSAYRPCAICGESAVKASTHFGFGIWNDSQQTLTRQHSQAALTECANCQHVQSQADYSPTLFEQLYFHSEQEAVMWHESLVDSALPYEQMRDFALANVKQASLVADFGCGTGSLLHSFAQLGGIEHLHGVDFNPRLDKQDIHYHAADLNDPQAFAALPFAGQVELACASHTLEHVLSPVKFLRSVAATLTKNGAIFIEVPDFGQCLPEAYAIQANLVNFQHIHYFNAASLNLCAQQAGLAVLKIRSLATAYIPRLQAILVPNEHLSENASVIPASLPAMQGVEHIQASIAVAYRALIAGMRALLLEHQKLGLWGIGADYYALSGFAEFRNLLAKEQVILFDRELAGHVVDQKTIQDSAGLAHANYPILMLPRLAETRIKMHAISYQWCTHIIDLYRPSAKALELGDTSECKLCRNNNWHKLDTLLSGTWKPEGKQLVRDGLSLDIQQCTTCGHCQITNTYTPAMFQQLYFSSEQAPQMWPQLQDEESPYAHMLELFEDRLQSCKNLADFGCGEGLLLAEIAKQAPHINLYGLDFEVGKIATPLVGIGCDLNDPLSIRQALQGLKFEIIVSSHVLEHVIDPVAYLISIRQHLNHQGQLFIEVPDASPSGVDLPLYSTNLVHGQHIHYFSRESLVYCAAIAGFTPISIVQRRSYGIPRLQILLAPGPVAGSRKIPSVADSARSLIEARFMQYSAKINAFSASLLGLLDAYASVAVWGVGGDFYHLYKASSELQQAIAKQRVVLFDKQWAGYCFAGSEIRHSDGLNTVESPILLAPMYIPTLDNMHNLAQSWGVKVINPYC